MESHKLKQTFARYKGLIEQTIVGEKIAMEAWQNARIEFGRQNNECNMHCVDVCYTEESSRF